MQALLHDRSMEAVGAIFTFLLIIASLVGLLWTMVGLPVGIVLLILKSNKKTDISKKRILILTFGGIGLLTISFVLFFILSVILSFFGHSSSSLILPNIPE